MYFLYPKFLWAFALLSVPVIIHFFNIRRYKKIYFSDIRWIKQITQESQVKNKLKEYLILISRLFALSFLILAFAQPVLKKNNVIISNSKNTDIIIYIDNSFSMENVSKDGKLFETALSKAKEIIQSFPKSSKFYILTNDADIQLLKPLSQNESVEFLSKVKISSASVSLSVIFSRINTLHLSSPVLFIFSDAQKRFTDIQNIQNNRIFTYYFLLSATQKNNISIDSIWIDNPVILPDISYQLHIKITNHNSENISDVPLKLILNDIQTSINNISIPAHQSAETVISFIPKNKPFQFGKVFINDYPVTFDDEMFFSLNTNIRIKTMIINGSNNPPSSKYFQSFFKNDSVFVFSEQQEKQINFSELARQDVVILNEISEFSSGLEEQLKLLCNKGKTIIIIPHIQNNSIHLPSEIQQYQWKTDTSAQNLSSDIFSHPLLKSSFEKTNHSYKLPIVREYIYPNNSSYFENILLLNNNKPLLIKYVKNKWNYFVFTSAFNPEKNQLPLHSVFIPLMYHLSFTSIPSIPLYYYSKTSQNISVPNVTFNSDDSPKIISSNLKSNNFQIIPIFRSEGFSSYISIPVHYDIIPGHYYLQWKQKNIFAMSFNYNRMESDMQFYSPQEIKDIVKQYNIQNFNINELSGISAQKIILSEISGQSYWKLCLILCLIFFITESLIIRFWK